MKQYFILFLFILFGKFIFHLISLPCETKFIFPLVGYSQQLYPKHHRKRMISYVNDAQFDESQPQSPSDGEMGNNQQNGENCNNNGFTIFKLLYFINFT